MEDKHVAANLQLSRRNVTKYPFCWRFLSALGFVLYIRVIFKWTVPRFEKCQGYITHVTVQKLVAFVSDLIDKR